MGGETPRPDPSWLLYGPCEIWYNAPMPEPDLIDELAVRFKEKGLNVKALKKPVAKYSVNIKGVVFNFGWMDQRKGISVYDAKGIQYRAKLSGSIRDDIMKIEDDLFNTAILYKGTEGIDALMHYTDEGFLYKTCHRTAITYTLISVHYTRYLMVLNHKRNTLDIMNRPSVCYPLSISTPIIDIKRVIKSLDEDRNPFKTPAKNFIY